MTDVDVNAGRPGDLDDGSVRLLIGDCRARLRELPDQSVHCCVTSPPYWGLRDYGTASWEGGDPACEHRVGDQVSDSKAPGAITTGQRPGADASACRRCGARRVDAQLGLERTPEGYVAELVAVLREVKRVLRDDGTLWLNLGDSYAARWGSKRSEGRAGLEDNDRTRGGPVPAGLKEKDLVGIPWMVAFALRADGWYLRSDIIFAKANVMPESVEDRPTKAHEYVFLLAKSPSYYYDAVAICEPAITQDTRRPHGSPGMRAMDGRAADQWRGGEQRAETAAAGATRNRRSVWPITSQGYRDESHEHFAVMPEELARLCVLAGSSERGACASCGAPWRRVLERSKTVFRPSPRQEAKRAAGLSTAMHGTVVESPTQRTVGWEPSCTPRDALGGGGDCAREGWDGTEEHAARLVVPCVVLDPFSGAGTTLLVAREAGRRAVGVELNPKYARLAWRRTSQGVMPFAGGLGRAP